ncbi:hypothetical protein RSK60_80004 [Ralstonia solanacearum K60]|nr:hypothetical protein RSK60_80004 [Ralstonia solanacearum K60]
MDWADALLCVTGCVPRMLALDIVSGDFPGAADAAQRVEVQCFVDWTKDLSLHNRDGPG